MRRSGVGILAVCVGSALAAGPAGAQQAQQAPACDARPSTLEWQVRKDRNKRSVNLRFRKDSVAGGRSATGAPLKPVQVRIERPSGARAFEWQTLNRDHFSYRRRGREVVSLTARYVENRSDYQALGSPDQGTTLPNLPLVPNLITLPAIPNIPGLTIPIPLLPLITGPTGGGGGEFKADYCARTITRTAR